MPRQAATWRAPPVLCSAAALSAGAVRRGAALLPFLRPAGRPVSAPAHRVLLCFPLPCTALYCPVLPCSEIAELKRSPPEILQREWKGLAQQLT